MPWDSRSRDAGLSCHTAGSILVWRSSYSIGVRFFSAPLHRPPNSARAMPAFVSTRSRLSHMPISPARLDRLTIRLHRSWRP